MDVEHSMTLYHNDLVEKGIFIQRDWIMAYQSTLGKISRWTYITHNLMPCILHGKLELGDITLTIDQEGRCEECGRGNDVRYYKCNNENPKEVKYEELSKIVASTHSSNIDGHSEPKCIIGGDYMRSPLKLIGALGSELTIDDNNWTETINTIMDGHERPFGIIHCESSDDHNKSSRDIPELPVTGTYSDKPLTTEMHHSVEPSIGHLSVPVSNFSKHSI